MPVSEVQFYVAIVIVPMVSVLVMLAGLVIQNSNINARVSELRSDFKDALRAEIGTVRAESRGEFAALRAEMAKNHSEMLHRFADLDSRLQRVEQR